MMDHELMKKNDDIIMNEIIELGMRKIGNRDKLLWDGVVSAKEYLDKENTKYKIMWMLKEPYDTNNCGGYKLGENLLDQKERAKIAAGKILPTLRVMIYVTYGLLNDKPFEKMNTDIDSEMLEVLTRIAWVNISKILAKSESCGNHIDGCYKYWKEILFKQIKTYSPDILIFGGTFKFFKNDWEEYFGELPKGHKKAPPPPHYFLHHFIQNNMRIIYICHPGETSWSKQPIGDYLNNIIEAVYAARRK
jgi:hypothetical protein